MTENELIALWTRARWHIIVSQLAPTLLLAASVWLLLEGLGAAPLAVRLAATGILLASGVLGATAQVSAANEARAVIDDLRALPAASAIAKRIIASARGVDIVRYVGPAIFVLTFVALLAALYL